MTKADKTTATKTAETPSLVTKEAREKYQTKSAMIKYLASKGLVVKDVHKIMVGAGYVSAKTGDPIRYQHVRNVMKAPAKKTQENTAS